MAHILFSFSFFFVLFVLNDLGLPFALSPGLVQVSFQFTSFFFLLYHLVLWWILPLNILNILHFFCWSSQVASCENILWTLTLIKPRLCLWTRTLNCPYMAAVFPSRSRILYKFSELQASRTILCVSGLSVNSPEISHQMGKYHPLLHLLAPVFQIMWTMTQSLRLHVPFYGNP